MNEERRAKPLTVGRLAKQTGLSSKAIRYYEQEKLIPKAARSTWGYRLYDPNVIERLMFIRKAKAVGFHLEDIRRILALSDRGRPCCDQVYEWSERRLHELDEKIKFLSELKKRIIHYRKQWELQPQPQSHAMPEDKICKLIAKVELPETKS